MKAYQELVEKVLNSGELRENRTEFRTMSVFGEMFEHNLQKGFPLLTSKKMSLEFIAGELRWFLNGDTRPSTLNSKIWDDWAYEDSIGPMYGSIWRDYKLPNGESVDQIEGLINNLRNNPNSRRHVITTLHLGAVPDESMSPQENVKQGRGALYPCHGLTVQCNVRDGKYLDLIMFQRSADTALGVPYNIASYALLTHILANETGLEAGVLKIVFGDLHIYENHLENIKEQMSREFKDLPTLDCKPDLDFKIEDIKLKDYNPHKAVKYVIAV